MNKEEFKNLKEGDLVQVKSLKEIYDTLEQDGEEMVGKSFTGWSDSFVKSMERMCGKTVEVEHVTELTIELAGGENFNYIPEWLDVVK